LGASAARRAPLAAQLRFHPLVITSQAMGVCQRANLIGLYCDFKRDISPGPHHGYYSHQHGGRRRAPDVQEQFAANDLKLPYNEYQPFTPVDTTS
jgi:hypothetical protein